MSTRELFTEQIKTASLVMPGDHAKSFQVFRSFGWVTSISADAVNVGRLVAIDTVYDTQIINNWNLIIK